MTDSDPFVSAAQFLSLLSTTVRPKDCRTRTVALEPLAPFSECLPYWPCLLCPAGLWLGRDGKRWRATRRNWRSRLDKRNRSLRDGRNCSLPGV